VREFRSPNVHPRAAFLVAACAHRVDVVDADHWTVERHLSGKSDAVVELYRRFIAQVEACGPFTYAVTKSAIALKGSRRGFAGAKPKQRTLDGFLDLQHVVHDSRILRSSPYTKRLYVHQFRVSSIADLDDEFASWVQEAYDVGAGAHLSQ
jgi:hypothetical protein